MSVLIKGMDMPNNCADCVFIDYFRGQWYCHALNDMVGTGASERNEHCPLVLVPPHGRLIDADALLRHMRKVHDEWKMSGHCTPTIDDEIMVMYMPTIIEAEE